MSDLDIAQSGALTVVFSPGSCPPSCLPSSAHTSSCPAILLFMLWIFLPTLWNSATIFWVEWKWQKLSSPFPWPTSCRCGPWTACWSRPCWPHPCWNGMPAVSGWCQCCTDGDMMMMLWKVFQYVDELMQIVFLVLLPSEDMSCCLWSHPQLFCAGCLSFPASLSFKLNRRGHRYIYFGRCQTFLKIFWSLNRPGIPRRLSCSFRRSIQRLYRNCPGHL